MKQVKLVIWDLDETYWNGTLSEGPIEYEQAHHDVVLELTRRGIVNSICSKNTFDDARACLQKHGIWDWFVFARIAWEPKGQMIASIIEDMQLRPENVLFIDDNHLNLEEARFFCPEIQTAGPDIIEKLLALDACRGKDDIKLSRLNQYKLLEQKAVDQKSASGGNDDFPRSCAIAAKVGHDCISHRDRILELINRTNQLNYTKHRLTENEIDELLADGSLDTGYVQVSDRYGEYGLCGFYAKRGVRLEHFLFSCRILNMGVENWLYKRLGCPELEIAGEVVTALKPDMTIDWIAEASDTAVSAPQEPAAPTAAASGISIIVKGGCDLLQIKNYLMQGSRFEAEVYYVSATKGMMVKNAHTEVLKRCTAATIQTYGPVIDAVPFFDRQAFETRLFDSRQNVIVYSVLEDYSRGLYRYRDTDLIIPFDDFTIDATAPENWHMHLENNEKHRLTPEFLEWFNNNFTFLGAITAGAFHENMRWLCDRIPRDKLLIILNGSEVAYTPVPENNRWEHHRMMNAVLDDALNGVPHAVICDVRQLLTSPEDHRHNIRHYSRRVYFDIAEQINAVIQDRLAVSIGFWERQRNLFKISKKVTRTFLKKGIKKAVRRLLSA